MKLLWNFWWVTWDWKKEYVENSISSDFLTKVGDVFTIDIQQLASNISPDGSSQDILKEAQIWLSGKLGGKVNPDTSSSFDVSVTVITKRFGIWKFHHW